MATALPAQPTRQPAMYKRLQLRIDGVSFEIDTFDDPEGMRLQQQWKRYIDERIIPQMNPATLYQLSAY